MCRVDATKQVVMKALCFKSSLMSTALQILFFFYTRVRCLSTLYVNLEVIGLGQNNLSLFTAAAYENGTLDKLIFLTFKQKG